MKYKDHTFLEHTSVYDVIQMWTILEIRGHTVNIKANL